MSEKAKPRSPWPYAIIAYFLVFGSLMAVWVAYAVRTDMQLVRKDYYEDDIRYQRQIERIQRARMLAGLEVAYSPETQELTIALPEEHRGARSEGTIHFYRPSDAMLDHRQPLRVPENGPQRIDVSRFQHGYWKVQIQWTTGGKEYFHAIPLLLERAPAAGSAAGSSL